MVQCYAQTICLKDDAAEIERYKAYHAEAWPEVLHALKSVGVLEMKIYLLGARLFMYFETVDGFDPAVDFPRHMELNAKVREWGDLMRGFQEPAPEAAPGDWWAYMEEVFNLSDSLERAARGDPAGARRAWVDYIPRIGSPTPSFAAPNPPRYPFTLLATPSALSARA